MTVPWFRASANMHADVLVRKARAGAAWHWVLCRLKDSRGWATDNDLDPWRAGEDMHIPESIALDQIEGLKRVGLLVRDGELWTTPNWNRYNPPDKRPRSDKRTPVDVGESPTRPKVSQTSRLSQRRDGTGRDGTGRDKTQETQAAGAAGLDDSEVAQDGPKPKKETKGARIAREAVDVYAHFCKARGWESERDCSTTSGLAKGRLAKVKARLADGFTVEEVCGVVDFSMRDGFYSNGHNDLMTTMTVKSFGRIRDQVGPRRGPSAPLKIVEAPTGKVGVDAADAAFFDAMEVGP